MIPNELLVEESGISYIAVIEDRERVQREVHTRRDMELSLCSRLCHLSKNLDN